MKAQSQADFEQRHQLRGTARPTNKHRRILKAERERAKIANRINLPWSDDE